MVEFLRDVIIAVAILATLVAVALHPSPEPDADRHGRTLDHSRAVAAAHQAGPAAGAYRATPQAAPNK